MPYAPSTRTPPAPSTSYPSASPGTTPPSALSAPEVRARGRRTLEQQLAFLSITLIPWSTSLDASLLLEWIGLALCCLPTLSILDLFRAPLVILLVPHIPPLSLHPHLQPNSISTRNSAGVGHSRTPSEAAPDLWRQTLCKQKSHGNTILHTTHRLTNRHRPLWCAEVAPVVLPTPTTPRCPTVQHPPETVLPSTPSPASACSNSFL